MNEVGKMGRRNSKIPGSRVKNQKKPKQSTQLSTVEPMMEGQEKPKQYNELSQKEQESFKNDLLKDIKIYADSDAKLKKQMSSRVLQSHGLDINNANNRKTVSNLISKWRKRVRENEALTSIKKPRYRNKLPQSLLEEINKFIVDNSYGIKYLEAKNRFERTKITKIVSNKFGIDNYSENRNMIQRLILQTTYKPWSDEEEKTLEELLREKINTVVWNKLGDKNKITQIRRQIIKDFKRKFPNNEHNDRDIMYKINLLVYHIKNTTPKPISVKSRESKPIRSRQIKPVKQGISKIIGEEKQFGNVGKKLDKQLNNQQTEEQDTTCNVGKTHDDIIADTNEILPFFWNNDVFDDCENYPVL